MLDFDLLIRELQDTIKDNLLCEDNELHIKSKLKYDVYNIMKKYDSAFMSGLEKELEYKDDE